MLSHPGSVLTCDYHAEMSLRKEKEALGALPVPPLRYEALWCHGTSVALSIGVLAQFCLILAVGPWSSGFYP